MTTSSPVASDAARGLARDPIDPDRLTLAFGRTRVLVVDDSTPNIQLLSRSLMRLGFEVATAERGTAALEAIETGQHDIVLLDVLMPDLSGLEVLRRLRSRPETADLPVILVSGLDETSDIVEGLRLGANDYVTKPINLPVLQARLNTQADLKRARDDLKRTASLLADENQRHAADLLTARHVQRSLLPQAPPPSDRIATAWCYEPATEVGGDLFDLIPLSGGRMLLFVADAMGHGVQAALVISAVKAALGANLRGGEDLPGLLDRLDRALSKLFEDRFITAAACLVDPDAGRLFYAGAGHPPTLLAGTGGVLNLGAGGPPLGSGLGGGYVGGEVAFAPGTALLLYSDGLTEALDPFGRQFGHDRLIGHFTALADRPANEIVAGLRRELDEFRGNVPLIDDLTLVAARLQ